MVCPEVINDERMVIVARDIAKQIESEMEYPGQIKVNMIRESARLIMPNKLQPLCLHRGIFFTRRKNNGRRRNTFSGCGRDL